MNRLQRRFSCAHDCLLATALLIAAGLICTFCCASVAAQDPTGVRYTQGQTNESPTMSLNLAFGSYKSRGMEFPISFNYSSNLWSIEHLAKVAQPSNVSQSITEAIYAKHSSAGWNSSLDLPQIEFPKQEDTYDYLGKVYPNGSYPCFGYRINRVFLHMPDGSTHELRRADEPTTLWERSGTYYAVDGSRIRFDANGTADTGTIFMPDGTRYVLGHPYSYIIDRHGNQIAYDEHSLTWTDSLGRTFQNPFMASHVVGSYDLQLPGLPGVNNGVQIYTFVWDHLSNALTPDDQNNTPPLRTVASHYLPFPLAPPTSPSGYNYPQPQPSPASYLFESRYNEDINGNQALYPTIVVGKGQAGGAAFDPIVLTEIRLPDYAPGNVSSYRFSYNVYGEIDRVIYPTGAYDKYNYVTAATSFDEVTNEPYEQANRRLSWRKIYENPSSYVQWTYSDTVDWSGRTVTATAPDGTRTEIVKVESQNGLAKLGYQTSLNGMVTERRVYSSTNDILRRELTQYEETSHSWTWQSTCNTHTYQVPVTASRNPRPLRRTTIVFEGTGPALAESSSFQYDTSNEMTTGIDQIYADAHDFVVVDHSTAEQGAITAIPLGTRSKYTQTEFSPDATYRNANILGLPMKVTVRNNSDQVVSRSTMSYDDTGYVADTHDGLPTTMGTWDSTKGSDPDNTAYFLYTHATFDQYGNRTIATDAKGFATTTTYDQDFNTYPVSVTTAVPDDSGIHASATAFTSYTSYDTTTGLVLSTTDINGQTTTMQYNDALLRPTRVTAPNGAQTITQYGAGIDASSRWVKVKTQIDADHWSEAKSFYDGLGRTYKTQKTDTADVDGDIFTLTCYDNMGRVAKTSNPFRGTVPPCTDTTLQWTKPEYDDLSRTIKVTSPDPTSTPTTVQVSYGLSMSSPYGTTKTITDQAGKTRKGITDALGNMVEVIEDVGSGHQNLVTDYIFDTLGNLRKTTQGDQIRYFNYDSLGRVLRAKQVEQTVNSNLVLPTPDPITNNNDWTKKYTYDNNSNILTTTDAKNVTITATYDRLNRLITRVYNDSPQTPAVDFYYDGKGLPSTPSLANGKTTRVVSSISDARNTSFDSMGHTLTSEQITDGRTFDFSYTYNLGGALIEETYPSGRVVHDTLNANGQLEEVQSRKNANQGYWAYANNFSYSAAGAVTKIQLGNGHWETATYNEREQVKMIGLGTTNDQQNLLKLDFEYTGASPNTNVADRNNGSMRKQTITVPTVGSNTGFSAVQTVNYDSLSRITDVTENLTPIGGTATQTWKQTFLYDRYGNRTFDANNTTTIPQNCSTAVCNPGINLANDNRFNSGQNYSYDANGAVTQNAANERFGYDAESRQTAFFIANNGGSTPDATYAYDGLAHRVKKINGTEVTIFVYDAGGQLSAEYSTTVASLQDAKVDYVTADHLGSPRIATDASGAVISRKDFTAFGETVTSSQRVSGTSGNGYDAPNIRQDYTGYQKDSGILESNLEYSQARYYNPGHGRFTSVDPLASSATVRNPQSLNRYSYVTNSPYKFVDPLGLMLQDIGVFQTDDSFEAERAEHQSLRDLQEGVNQDYKDSHPAEPLGPGPAIPDILPPDSGDVIVFATVGEEDTKGKIILADGEGGTGRHKQGRNFLYAVITSAIDLVNDDITPLYYGTVKGHYGLQGILDMAGIESAGAIFLFTHGNAENLFLGDGKPDDYNTVNMKNVKTLHKKGGSLADIWIFGCNAGAKSDGIAAALSKQLGVRITAATGGMIFSKYRDKPDGLKIHPAGPTYLVHNGGGWRVFEP